MGTNGGHNSPCKYYSVNYHFTTFETNLYTPTGESRYYTIVLGLNRRVTLIDLSPVLCILLNKVLHVQTLGTLLPVFTFLGILTEPKDGPPLKTVILFPPP